MITSMPTFVELYIHINSAALPLLLETSSTSSNRYHYIFVGSDGTLTQLAYDIAVTEGFKIPFDNVAIFGSHSHSGPGAISPEMLWELAPATDLLVPGSSVCMDILDKVVGNVELQKMFATSIANAMLEAQENLQEGSIGMGE